MPRWASRITLEVTGVRVERLQDISEEDALAEGIEPPRCPLCNYTLFDCQIHMDHHLCCKTEPASAIPVFAGTWDEINGKRAPWESNPWVWVVEFRRVILLLQRR
jgi:hypothetical protein